MWRVVSLLVMSAFSERAALELVRRTRSRRLYAQYRTAIRSRR